MRLGAIDIGSNAARVLIKEVKEVNGELEYSKLKLLRYPIRLGVDSFLLGKISDTKEDKMVKMCTIFKLLMELYDVEDYTAYATSAMRDASNGNELAERVRRDTGIDIEIISGNQEAVILYQTHFEQTMNPNRNYVYVDVGGGSTEVSLFEHGKLRKSRSFKVGTIRLLHGLVGEPQLQEMANWMKEEAGNKTHYGIGSGGNINTLKSHSGLSIDTPISLDYIKEKYHEFSAYSVDELMRIYSFKQDRADVICHALNIYIHIYGSANVSEVFVPKIGLSDGMIRLLAKQKHAEKAIK